jgi:hypothetical protein
MKYLANRALGSGHNKFESPLRAKDVFGNTPLHFATICGFEKGIALLMKREEGAQVADISNMEGWRPKDLAQDPNIKKIFEDKIAKNKTSEKTHKEHTDRIF